MSCDMGRCRSRDPIPDTAQRAVEIIEGGGLAQTDAITVRSVSGDPYERIIDCELGPLPEPIAAGRLEYGEEDCPF